MVNEIRYDGAPIVRGDYVSIPFGQGRRLHPVTGSRQTRSAMAHMRAARVRALAVARWTGSEWLDTGMVVTDYPAA